MKTRHAQAPRDPAPPTHSIGLPRPLVDGPDKVSGRALYTADLPFPGALVGRIGLSRVPPGRTGISSRHWLGVSVRS